MNKIKNLILDSTNWLEVNIENEEGVIIHCESFGDSDEYQALLRQRLQELGTQITDKLKELLLTQIKNRHIPTTEEISENIAKLEQQRVQNINSYTQSIITKKYPLGKQSSANLGIYGDEYKNEMISFISNCITLSNEAIDNGTALEDINWEVFNGINT